MTKKTEFEVTEKAGLFVAGQRSPGAGKNIPLTEEQAVYALAAGELRRTGQITRKAPKAAKSPKPTEPVKPEEDAPAA